MTRHNGKFISYLRVSTAKQGSSGLGLEGQRAAVEAWLNGGSWQLIEEVVEIESGRSHRNRPGLARALEACRRFGAKLIISRLDRLSRDPVFLLSLRDAGIDFTAVDMPNANRMTVGVMALVAEQEREAISVRTKAALAAAKARGVKLGCPRPETAIFRDRAVAAAAGVKGGASAKQSANKFAELVRPLLEQDLAGVSANAAAQELNRRGVQTPRGGAWTARAVINVRARLG
jgi:DNA invertase Pin-like site-specific DNA recombinase